MTERMAPCPIHSSFANSFRLYGPRHECFTVYDAPAEPTHGDLTTPTPTTEPEETL